MVSVFELIRGAGPPGVDPLLSVDALGRSALHFAAARGAEATCGRLLELGLKPYVLDKQRNTPLHLAGEWVCGCGVGRRQPVGACWSWG